MNMKFRVAAFMTGLSLLSTTGDAAAQSQPASADVTFQVPLNITNLESDVTKIRVTCSLAGPPGGGRSGELEFPVVGGQVVATAQVLVLIPASAVDSTAIGRTQRYQCELFGLTPSRGWQAFARSYGTAAEVYFRTTQPVPILTGNFTW